MPDYATQRVLRWLLEGGFSNPKIIVSNGKEAKVDMTTKEPNVTGDANDTGTSSQNLSISTKLEVIPGEDKQIFAKEAFFS